MMNPRPATGALNAQIALIDCAYAWTIKPLSGCYDNTTLNP